MTMVMITFMLMITTTTTTTTMTLIMMMMMIMIIIIITIMFSMVQQTVACQGFLKIGASRSHSVTPHSVGLFWTSDRPVAEDYT